MLIGAFFGVVGSYYLQSALLGMLLAGMAASLLYGFFLIQLKAREAILGFGFNMFAIAITGWLLGPVFGGGVVLRPHRPLARQNHNPGVDAFPLLRVLSGHNIIVYLSWSLVLTLSLLVYKTRSATKSASSARIPRRLPPTA